MSIERAIMQFDMEVFRELKSLFVYCGWMLQRLFLVYRGATEQSDLHGLSEAKMI